MLACLVFVDATALSRRSCGQSLSSRKPVRLQILHAPDGGQARRGQQRERLGSRAQPSPAAEAESCETRGHGSAHAPNPRMPQGTWRFLLCHHPRAHSPEIPHRQQAENIATALRKLFEVGLLLDISPAPVKAATRKKTKRKKRATADEEGRAAVEPAGQRPASQRGASARGGRKVFMCRKVSLADVEASTELNQERLRLQVSLAAFS